MKAIKDLTPQDIERMNYNGLIGIVKETNRPPGGRESIYHIASRCFLNSKSKVLEVGTSTGFTAIELAKLTKCRVKAIDINEVSLKEARRRWRKENIENLVDFVKADATNIPFKNNYFDLVFCGNVTSIINDKEKVLGEYMRVTKNAGFIAAIPMYYIKKPQMSLLKKVSGALQVDIEPLTKQYWLSFFNDSGLELYWTKDFKFQNQSKGRIEFFLKKILSREHLNKLTKESKIILDSKYKRFIHLFNENLSYMGFSIILLRKKASYDEDPSLFTSIAI